MPETPSPRQEKQPSETPELPRRETLRRESLQKIRTVVPEDSDAYSHAALATESFLKRTLGAAVLVDQELTKNTALPFGDDKRLTPEEALQYEDFLTQAEALAMILPKLLQQARIVQYQPDTEERLRSVFEIIHEREILIQNMERGRATILLGTRRRGSPMRPGEIEELVPLATLAWMTREKLSPRPELSQTQKERMSRLVESLQIGEGRYRTKTEAVGDTFTETGKTADRERRKAGAERITQGFPSAELILDTPEFSMTVWEYLLTKGGKNEKVRAARQLKEGIREFQKDFLELRAYEKFTQEAKTALKEHMRKNENISRWFDVFDIPGKEFLKDRALTSPTEFQNIFDLVTKKMKGDFDAIASSDDAKSLGEFLVMLEQMEKEENVEEVRLRELLTSYARLQAHTGSVLATLQRWQIAENVGRVGATEQPNMLDQTTRIGGKTLWLRLQELAPYGVFRTRSYKAEDGRIILLAPTSPDTLKDQLKEGSKAYLAVETAILTPILHRMAMRIPLLGKRLFGRWYAKVGVPIALAEMSIAGAKSGAAMVRMRQALDAVEVSLGRLEAAPGSLQESLVHREADSVFQHLLIALQAAEGSSPDTPNVELAAEAHLYTNQLLMALNFPPYHELSPEAVPSQRPEMSQELKEYLQLRERERQGVSVATRSKLDDLDLSIQNRRTPEFSTADELLRSGAIPTAVGTDSLLQAMQEALHRPEFRQLKYDETTLGANERAQRKKAFETAGEVSLTYNKLRKIELETQNRLKEKYVGRESVDPNKKTAIGPHTFSLNDVEKDIRRLGTLSPMEILTIARYLEMHEPTNAEIAAMWYKEPYPPTGISRLFGGKRFADNGMNQNFGAPGNRTGLGEKFLKKWVGVWGYETWMLRGK